MSADKPLAHPREKRLTILGFLSAIAIAIAPPLFGAPVADDAETVPDSSYSGQWQFLGAPYVTGDSDFGLIFGVATGVAKPPNLALIINGSVALKGLAGATVFGEAGSDKVKYSGRISLWRFPTKLYHETGAPPDWYASAMLERGEFQVAALRRLGPHLEAGPETWNEFARGTVVEDPDNRPLDVNDLPRYRFGMLNMLGLRVRYRTTSAVRPLDGIILDAAIRGGRTDGDQYTHPRATLAADIRAAIARPVLPRTRVYLRGWGRFQSEAATSIRNPIGGIYTLRGQPYGRDYGRRMLAGRFQVHWTAVPGIRWIGRTVNSLLPFIPAWPLDLEAAPFADIGAVADPDYGGWRRTRQGYGLSLRLVLPPELVFFFDVAITPGGNPMFYFGGGESL